MTKPFNVTLIQPQGYIHSLALKEAGEYLCAMLNHCGYRAQFTTNQLLPDFYNVILCAHLLGASDILAIPPDSIIFNSEQLEDVDGWHFSSGTYAKLLQQFYVWDYSKINLAKIKNPHKDFIPFWYCEELVRTYLPRKPGRSLLFYGSLTPRRKKILSEIEAKGIKVEVMFGMYDMQRDHKMFNAWAVLNLHKSNDIAVFEPIRCFYPLINKIPVISEEVRGDPTADDFRDSMFFFERKTFADSILNLYKNDALLAEETERQFTHFEKQSGQSNITVAATRFIQLRNTCLPKSPSP